MYQAGTIPDTSGREKRTKAKVVSRLRSSRGRKCLGSMCQLAVLESGGLTSSLLVSFSNAIMT